MLCTRYGLAVIIFNLPNAILVNYLHQHLRTGYISSIFLYKITEIKTDAAYPFEIDW